MKKKALIISLSIVVVILSLILYIFYDTSPKQIENEEIGTMYSFDIIQFNLLSNDYKINQEFYDIAKEEGYDFSSSNLFLTNSNDLEHIIISKSSEETFNLYYMSSQKPFLKQISEILTLGKRIVYTGNNKICILNKSTVTPSLEIKIGSSYYSFLLGLNADPQNLFEFMRTVNIK